MKILLLKRLEAYGFKSFADKLEVELREYVEEELNSENINATVFAVSYLNRVYWDEIVAVGLANLKEKQNEAK